MNCRLLVLVGIAGVGSAALPREDDLRLHLLFTNDLHGALEPQEAPFINPEFPPTTGNGSAMAAYVREVRKGAAAEVEGVVLVDAGNWFQGTALGRLDGGAAVVDWMSETMGFDAAAIGASDFDFGAKNLSRLAERASFPLLGTNLVEEASGQPAPFCEPYVLKEAGGVLVGIVGVTTTRAERLQYPWRLEGISLEPEVEAAQQAVNAVREAGADFVILLGHLGLPYDVEAAYTSLEEETESPESSREAPVNSMELARRVTGIDVLVSGHVMRGYLQPWEDPVTHTLCLQSYGAGTSLGHLVLTFDRTTRQLKGFEPASDRGVLLTLFDDDFRRDPGTASGLEAQSARARRESAVRAHDPFPAERQTRERGNRWEIPSVGTEETLEIATWNVEHFPKAGEASIEAVAEVIADLGADIIGLQEIEEKAGLTRLLEYLPEYDCVASEQSSFMDQVLLVRRGRVSVRAVEELFASDDYWFAGRPPLKADVDIHTPDGDRPLSVTVLHMKCCDDGVYRRETASRMLAERLMEGEGKGEPPAVVIGDWNDELTDPWHENSLRPFIGDPRFRFVTFQIASDTAQWSYPSWPSFLDHILVTGPLAAEGSHGKASTIRLHDFTGGWTAYENALSDHLPVVWSVPLNELPSPFP